MRTASVIIVGVIFLSALGAFFGIPSPFLGCANLQKAVPPPSEAELTAACIGEAPSQEEAERSIRSYLNGTLKDPESLRLRLGSIEKGWYNKGGGAPNKFAWLMIAGVNAKNSYGGYTGEQPYYFFFFNDELVAVGTFQTTYGRYGSSKYFDVVEFSGGGLTAEQASATPEKKTSTALELVGPPAHDKADVKSSSSSKE